MTKKLTPLYLIAFVSCTPLVETTPTPTPTTQPTIEPTPRQLSVFIVPEEAPVNSPVAVYLCENYVPNKELYADYRFKLGTFGENKASGCMQLIVSFNTPGARTLTVDEHKAMIFIGKK
jgi:hypothetical protein